jgi:hypothetical protein
VFGPTLTGGAPELWVLALAMTFLAATLLFTNYLLGVGVRRVVYVLVAGTVVTDFSLSAVHGGSLMAVAVVNLVCQAGLAVAVGLLVAAAGGLAPAVRLATARVSGSRQAAGGAAGGAAASAPAPRSTDPR